MYDRRLHESLSSGIMRQKIWYLGLFLTLGLQACVSRPPVVTPTDVTAAMAAQRPDEAYENLAARITPAVHGHRRQLSEQNLHVLGHRLAERLVASLKQQLASHTLSTGLIPLPVLEAATRRAAALQRYDADIAMRFDDDLEAQRQRTQTRIDHLQTLRATLDTNAYLERYRVLGELMDLTDDAGFSRERSDLVANLQDQVHTAHEHRNDAAMIAALTPLTVIDPDNEEFSRRLIAAQARLFNHEFWGEINAGHLQGAYEKFVAAAKMKNFSQFIADLPQSGGEMINFYLAQANAALLAQRADHAYDNLHRERSMRQLAGLGLNTLPEEKAFAERMVERYVVASKNGQHGQALGLLLAASEFSSHDDNLHALLHQELQLVRTHAQHTLSIPAFSSAAGQEALGAGLATRIAQELFHRIPYDVRIIDHDQFVALLKSNHGDHSPVDEVIEGRLLQAHIDTSEENGEKTMRVTTDSSEQPNPAYAKWQQLSAREQKKTEQPAPTIEVDQQQTIQVKMTRVRKVGTATAAFRLIDVRSNKILDTESPSFDIDVEDTGHEGVEIGKFHLPFKLPSLPSDAEIDDRLTAGLAQAIVDRLLPELAHADQRYTKKADRASADGDMTEASRYAAYAFALAQAKGKDTQTLQQHLCQWATRASNVNFPPAAPPAATLP